MMSCSLSALVLIVSVLPISSKQQSEPHLLAETRFQMLKKRMKQDITVDSNGHLYTLDNKKQLPKRLQFLGERGRRIAHAL